jgi:hypothetical protein
MALEFEGAPISMEPKLQYVQRKADERHAQPGSPHQKVGRHGRVGWNSRGGSVWVCWGFLGCLGCV